MDKERIEFIKNEINDLKHYNELYNYRHVIGIFASVIFLAFVVKCLLEPGIIGRGMAFGLLIPYCTCAALLPRYLYNKSIKKINKYEQEIREINNRSVKNKKENNYSYTIDQGIKPIDRSYEYDNDKTLVKKLTK